MNILTLFRIRSCRQKIGVFCSAVLWMLVAAAGVCAQSQDMSYPTPVSTNEISGQIAVRDIGDARLTRHFYLLAGTPGDFVMTVTSNNLNGDVDLFTAGSLRPLGKVGMYAGSTPTTATKTIFLRQRETLILRVEARSPNDNVGTYSVRFGGTFEAVLNAPTQSEDNTTAVIATESDRNEPGVRRVTSAGARIEEPEPERTTSTTTARTEARGTATGSTRETPTETPAPVEPSTRPESPRTARTRQPGGRRRIRVNPQTPRSSESSNRTPSTDSTPTPTGINPRLIIETRDGTRVERFMSAVQSVTVQNGQIVVVLRGGRRTERFSLATIVRMSIEP